MHEKGIEAGCSDTAYTFSSIRMFHNMIPQMTSKHNLGNRDLQHVEAGQDGDRRV